MRHLYVLASLAETLTEAVEEGVRLVDDRVEVCLSEEDFDDDELVVALQPVLQPHVGHELGAQQLVRHGRPVLGLPAQRQAVFGN